MDRGAGHRIDPRARLARYVLVDARGVTRPAYGMGLGIGERTEREHVPDEVLARVRGRLVAAKSARVEHSWKGVSALTYLVTLIAGVILWGPLAVIGVMVIIWLAWFLILNPLWLFAVLAIAGAAWGGYLLLGRRGLRSFSPQVVRDALLAERRCPACGYDVGARGPEADGCVVCPECGGAWKIPERPCEVCGQDLGQVRAAPDGVRECRVCGARYRWKG